MTEKIQSIPARIKNIAKGGHVAGTEDIIDDVSGKTQKEINTETGNKVDALQKQDIEAVTSLPAVSSADPKKIYRVAGETSYTDYMLNADGSQFVAIATYSFPGIDDEPTAGSDNPVKSGGVAATYGSYVENPEFVHVKTDSEGKILWAIKTDGSIYYGAGVPQQVKDYVTEHTDATKEELLTLINTKVDKEEGKSLIDANFATGIRYIDNSEWIHALLDSNNRLIKGVRTNGICYFNKIESPSLDNIKDDVLGINQKIPTEATPTNKLADKEFVLAAISGMQSNYVTTLTGEAIQNAINAGGVVELVPNATYICDSTIMWWYNKSIVHGNGATLLFPSDFSGVAVKARARHYSSQELFPFPNYFVRTFSGCIITKDGVTSKWSKRDDNDTTPGAQVRSGTGLSFEGAMIPDGITYSVAAKVDNCAIYGFDTGVIIGTYTWMVQIDHCDVCYNKYGLHVINAGENNYGESIRVTNCLIGGNCYGVWCSHIYGTVNVINTSFDYGYCAVCVDNGGHVFCTNCHLETTKDMDYYLKGNGNGTICVSNSVIFFNQSVYSFIGTSDSIGTQKCIFVIDNCVREVYSSPTNNINQQSEIRENGINY